MTGRLVAFDGVRGIAAVSVLGFHTWLYGPPGESAVDVGAAEIIFANLSLGLVLFFVLSGFLLYRPYASAILGLSAPPRVRDYALGRFLRIMPAYWFILACVALVLSAALVRDADGSLSLGDLRSDYPTLLANATLSQNLFPDTTITGIGPAWTLAVEAMFYVALPLLALPAIAYGLGTNPVCHRRVTLSLCPPCALLLVGVATDQLTLRVPSLAGPDWASNWQTVLQRSFLAHADLFSAGMIAGLLAVLFQRGVIRFSPQLRRGLLVASLGLLVLAVLAQSRGRLESAHYWTIVSISFAGILLYVATTGPRSLLSRSLEFRPLLYVGLVSYSLYLWHEPLIRLLDQHGLTIGGRWGLAMNFAVVLVLASAFAGITYAVVERPMMRWRTRHARTRGAPSAERHRGFEDGSPGLTGPAPPRPS